MAKKIQYTTAQKKVIESFKELCETDPAEAREELGSIIHLRADGAKIEGAGLARVFDKLGYFGTEAYRKQFNVDRTCAMTELCMLNVLSPEKQKSYEEQLAAKKMIR